MNLTKETYRAAGLAFLAGLAGLAARVLLYRVGFDEKGLLSRLHPLHLGCLVLTLVLGLWLCRTFRKPGEVESSGGLWGLLTLPAGALLLYDAVTQAHFLLGTLSILRLVTAFAAALAIFALASRLFRGELAPMVFYGALTIFFLVDLLCRYRAWSGNPQLPDYCFQVFACTGLAICSYLRMAAQAGMGRPRLHRFVSLMTLYLCLLSTSGPETRWFYLGGAFWSGAGLFALTPPAVQDTAPLEEEA